MDLGAFSVSLAVKDLAASRTFYEALGFEVFDGDVEKNWLMMRNGDAKLGLFQGMFEDDLLTFNPSDARTIQASLDEAGIALESRAQGDEGPCSLILKDPDGRVILIDQF